MQVLLKDELSRIKGPYEGGAMDVEAVAEGNNLYTSIDIELQKFGERLMTDASVAINPKTGGIIAMVSSPTYNPDYLTGTERRQNFSALYTDSQVTIT